jgi:hypothetical protein
VRLSFFFAHPLAFDTKEQPMRRIRLIAIAITPTLGMATAARAAVVGFTTAPPAIDIAVGTPLLPVPDDGMPLGTVYGSPGGIPLGTPIGLMDFLPTHDKTAAGTYHAIPAPGPIAGSDVVPPAGATAIDFFIESDSFATPSFEITAVGTLGSSPPILVFAPPGSPAYIGFAGFGETLVTVSIVRLPFPTPSTTTWKVSSIRVLPEPGSLLLLAAGALMIRRRRTAV